MDILLYGALLLSQVGISGKQYAMKKCGGLAPGPFNSVCINLMRSLICLAVSVVIWLMNGGGFTTAWGHIIIIISGVGTAFNLFTWILSTRLVSLILIESVSMIGSLVVLLILAPFLYEGDSVSPIQWVGCGLVFAVFVVLFAIFYSGEKRRFAAELPKGDVARVELPYKKVWGYVIMAAVSLYLYELFVVYAAYLPSAIYYPLSKGITVLCTFILDVIVFKDKVTSKKLICLAMVMVAIVLVTL